MFTSQRTEWQEMIRMIEEQNQDDKPRAEREVTLFFLSQALELTMVVQEHDD
jgi:hypothetical protein